MLAVLPFQNMTGDPAQEYISDGMTEELISQLGRLDPSRLGVIARTSVMPFKNTTKAADCRAVSPQIFCALIHASSCARVFFVMRPLMIIVPRRTRFARGFL